MIFSFLVRLSLPIAEFGLVNQKFNLIYESKSQFYKF